MRGLASWRSGERNGHKLTRDVYSSCVGESELLLEVVLDFSAEGYETSRSCFFPQVPGGFIMIIFFIETKLHSIQLGEVLHIKK